ncbi:MAG: RHS repeat-associated core domain-containing protein, partial [Acutalibacteraceae bacterium]
NGEIFWFIKNIRGDVVSVTDDKGITLADYLYDAWGDCTVKNDKSGYKIASANPFRYKGLYYDRETDLYCLGGSYYDSFTGGFITADIRKEKP